MAFLKYKVGQKVKIKPRYWEKPKPFADNSEMREMARKGTITHIVGRSDYVEGYHLANAPQWVWAENWLIPLPETKKLSETKFISAF